MLTLLNARCLMSGGFFAGRDWSLQFPKPSAIKCGAIVKGSCWLSITGQADPIHLEAGDVVLFDGRNPFRLASDLSLEPAAAVEVFRDRVDRIARVGAGEDFFYLGGHVAVDPAALDLLLDVLPPVIHVRAGSTEAMVLRWVLDQLYREMVTDRPGSVVASRQLAQLMFVQVLRTHIEASDLPAGWLRAIGDRQIAPALRLMHGEPGRNWQLGELAKAVGMSRTTFALRFKTVTGLAPLSYLMTWRMRLAERALRDGSVPVSALAFQLGYTSESAFSNAFKRVTGIAPKRYRTSVRQGDERVEELGSSSEGVIVAPAKYGPLQMAS
jgi:AraC-like DNA-binding protein